MSVCVLRPIAVEAGMRVRLTIFFCYEHLCFVFFWTASNNYLGRGLNSVCMDTSYYIGYV